MRLFGDVRGQYADFAARAAGESPCFEEWSLGVSRDDELLALIETLPPVKQQPNLVFAAARWNGVSAPAPFAVLRRAMLSGWPGIRSTVLSHSTQTNEVGRLATLLPAFAIVEAREAQSLALLEVGASAGLCLFPDRYSYLWSTADGTRTAGIDGPGSLTLQCTVTGPAPLPTQLPAVAWRAGLDLNPLDVRDRNAMAWLETLVWPEQEHRRVRLSQAIEQARSEPPRLVRADLLTAVPELLAQAPPGSTPVVFHSAVIAYLEPRDRDRFHHLMTALVRDGACHWISNEAESVLPAVSATRPDRSLSRLPFVLGIDGQAVARTHGHGSALQWLQAHGGEHP